jgi:hypothetical protein
MKSGSELIDDGGDAKPAPAPVATLEAGPAVRVEQDASSARAEYRAMSKSEDG